MKKIESFCGIAVSIAIVIILLVSSFEIAMYADFDFYQREYEKYDVLSDLNMEMDDVMYVTREMMSYLRGKRESLSVITTVDGQKQDFFNEQDRFHMWEVQKLFTGGLNLRKESVCVLLNGLLVMALCLEKERKRIAANMKVILCKSYQKTVGGLAVLAVFIGIWVTIDFNKVFTAFHEIFFDNDLWIFDPAEDYMIRMLPQGLFYDFVLRIGGIFFVLTAAGLAISIALCRTKKQVEKNRKNSKKC